MIIRDKTKPIEYAIFLKLLFNCHIRRVNAMFFLGKIDDIATCLTPTSMQANIRVDVFILSMYLFFRLIIHIIRAIMYQSNIRVIFVKRW